MQEAQSYRANPTPFSAKINKIVNNPDNKDLVSWTANGATFNGKDTNFFAWDLLPKYFKHNNFASFIRQLNNYGFRKLPDFEEWKHDLFKRGKKTSTCGDTTQKIICSEPCCLQCPSCNIRKHRRLGGHLPTKKCTTQDNVRFRDSGRDQAALKKNAALKQVTHEFKSTVQNICGFKENLTENEPATAFVVESSGNDDAEESDPASMEINLNYA